MNVEEAKNTEEQGESDAEDSETGPLETSVEPAVSDSVSRPIQDYTLLDRLKPMIGLAEQTVIALVVGLSACVIGGYYYSVYFTEARWIEIDEAPQRTYGFQLDINRADWAELSMLPGIGESLARRIVDDRIENGHYITVEQVQRVHGIGEKKLDAFRGYVLPIDQQTSLSTTARPTTARSTTARSTTAQSSKAN